MKSCRCLRGLTCLLPGLIIMVVGCSADATNRGAISGHVTLDGKPVEQGSILFLPIDGTVGVVTGGEIKDGQYELPAAKGPAIGRNRVEIHAMRKTGKMVPKGLGGTGGLVEEQAEAVAPRFNAQSTLTVDVKVGENIADFEVTSD